MGLIKPHTLHRPSGLIECASVLDIGAGIRPAGWFRAARHVCVEPHASYADVLSSAGFEVIGSTARDALEMCLEAGTRFEAVYLLDVIEHMEKEVGIEVLGLCQRVASRQVVVFTPDGFHPQSGDAWNMGGDHWQEHRSGWVAEDFPGFTVTRAQRGALFAIWNAS